MLYRHSTEKEINQNKLSFEMTFATYCLDRFSNVSVFAQRK